MVGMVDPSQVYVVPEQVLFRAFGVLSQNGTIQTRNLLLQNKSKQRLRGYISYPFTRFFRILTNDAAHVLKSNPPHIALDVDAGSSAKVVIQLAATEEASGDYLQDTLVVVLGDVVMTVLVRAVKHSLDPAGGAQLQAILGTLPFLPTHESLQQSCQQFMGQLQEQQGLKLQQLGSPGSSQTSSAASDAPAAQASSAAPPPQAHDEPRAPSIELPAPKPPASLPDMPPDTFSRPAAEQNEVGSDLEDASPVHVIQRPVVVQGRAAVAATGTSRSLSVGGGRAVLQRSASASSSAAQSAGQDATSMLPSRGSGQTQMVFLIDGRYYDARGREVPGGGQLPGAQVMDCAASRPGSSSSIRSAVDSTQGVPAPRTNSSSASMPSSSRPPPGPVPAPSQHLCGSTARAGDMIHRSGSGSGLSTALSTSMRSDPSPSSSVDSPNRNIVRNAGNSGRGGSDSMRQAALSAAMRDLGLTDLPPPLTAASSGAAKAAQEQQVRAMMRLRPRSGGMGSVSAVGDDGDLDLQDEFEARLQRNIETMMGPKAAASASASLAPMRPRSGRGPQLAPIPTVRRPSSSSSMRGPPVESLDYGDADADEKLQQQIESQLGSSASQRGAAGSIPGAKAPQAAGRLTRSASGSSAASASSKLDNSRSLSAHSGVQAKQLPTAASSISVSQPRSKAVAKPSGPAAASPGGKGLRAGVQSNAADARPSPEQLRAMQAAWDAL